MSHLSLYELGEEAQMAEAALMKWAEEHEGDITECPMVEIMEKIEGDIKNKLLGWGVWFKNVAAETGAIDEEIKNLTSRKKSLGNKAERIKATISHFLQDKRLESSKVVIRRTKSKQVVINDKGALEDRFLRKVTKTEPDKVAIKEAIKVGAKVEGAAVVDKENVSIK